MATSGYIDPFVGTMEDEMRKRLFDDHYPFCVVHGKLTWDDLLVEKKEYMSRDKTVVDTVENFICKRCYCDDGRKVVTLVVFVKIE